MGINLDMTQEHRVFFRQLSLKMCPIIVLLVGAGQQRLQTANVGKILDAGRLQSKGDPNA